MFQFQGMMVPVLGSLRALLDRLLSHPTPASLDQNVEGDGVDGFGPIRTANRQNSLISNSPDDERTRPLLQICISILACGPFLRSSTGISTRDQDLADMILKSSSYPESFCTASRIFFGFVRHKVFHLPLKILGRFFDEFEELLQQYSFSKNQTFAEVLVDFLGSIIGFWNSEDALARDLHSNFRELCAYLASRLIHNNCRSWTLRDEIVRFLRTYVAEDPSQESWSTVDNFEQDPGEHPICMPIALLPHLIADQDIRVRFRAATANADLFAISHHIHQTPLELYETMKQSFTLKLDE